MRRVVEVITRPVRQITIKTGRPWSRFRADYERAVPTFDGMEAIGVVRSGGSFPRMFICLARFLSATLQRRRTPVSLAAGRCGPHHSNELSPSSSSGGEDRAHIESLVVRVEIVDRLAPVFPRRGPIRRLMGTMNTFALTIRNALTVAVVVLGASLGFAGTAHAHGTYMPPVPHSRVHSQGPFSVLRQGPFSVLHQGPGPFSVLGQR